MADWVPTGLSVQDFLYVIQYINPGGVEVGVDFKNRKQNRGKSPIITQLYNYNSPTINSTWEFNGKYNLPTINSTASINITVSKTHQLKTRL